MQFENKKRVFCTLLGWCLVVLGGAACSLMSPLKMLQVLLGDMGGDDEGQG